MLPVYAAYKVHYRPTLAKKTYLVGLALAGPDVSGLPITMSCKKVQGGFAHTWVLHIVYVVCRHKQNEPLYKCGYFQNVLVFCTQENLLYLVTFVTEHHQSWLHYTEVK